MKDLNDRIAVITGAGSGMGRSIALSLAKEGIDVVAADIELETAQRTAEDARASGVQAIAAATDVSDREDVERLAEKAYAEFGHVDILVSNAGVATRPPAASWEVDRRDYRWLIDVNFFGVLHGHLAFVPRMLQQDRDSHVVNTSSTLALVTSGGFAAYSASKAAVTSFSMCARMEFEESNQPIGLSVLFPGMVKTRIGSSERLRGEDERGPRPKPWSEHALKEGYAGEEAVETMEGLTTRPLTEVTNFYQAIDPEEVGPLVVEGIRHNYEFISTHPAPADLISDRATRLGASFHGLG